MRLSIDIWAVCIFLLIIYSIAITKKPFKIMNKNNVGDAQFENDDRYQLSVRVVIYFLTALISPFLALWGACKTIGETERIGDKNIHL